MLDFSEFRNSNFYKFGSSKINTKTLEYVPWKFCAYEAIELPQLSSDHPKYSVDYTPPHGFIVPISLQKALKMEFLKGDNSPPFIPAAFKDEITAQYIQITDITRQLSTTLFRMILLICSPGTRMGTHVHRCEQTVTFLWKYQDEKIEGEPSRLEMGFKSRHKVYFPNSDKIMFSFRGDPPHDAITNEWSFFWVCDFNDRFDIPTNLPFTILQHEFLDADNLSEDDKTLKRPQDFSPDSFNAVRQK